MRAGESGCQGVEAPKASQKHTKGRPDEYKNPQETPRNRAEHEQAKRKYDGGGQDIRTGCTTSLGNGRDWERGQGQQGGGGWFKKWRGKDINQKR